MLTGLKIYVDLVDSGSFSRAATASYLTPSAVSQRIKALEEEIGLPLVIRSRGGVVPTRAGRAFYQASRDILDRHQKLLDDLDSLRGVVSGRLRVGSVTTVGLHELPPYVKTFLKQYPMVDLVLEYMGHRAIHEQLLRSDLDLGIVAYPRRDPWLRIVPFREDRLIIIAGPDDPLAGRSRVRISALEGRPFIGFEEGMSTGKSIDRGLRDAGVSVRVVHRFDNIETIKRAVEVGVGVAIVPDKSVEHEIRDGTLKRIDIGEDGWTRPIAVVYRRGRDLRLAAARFIEVLLAGT